MARFQIKEHDLRKTKPSNSKSECNLIAEANFEMNEESDWLLSIKTYLTNFKIEVRVCVAASGCQSTLIAH